jgi:hypothetical protein
VKPHTAFRRSFRSRRRKPSGSAVRSHAFLRNVTRGSQRKCLRPRTLRSFPYRGAAPGRSVTGFLRASPAGSDMRGRQRHECSDELRSASGRSSRAYRPSSRNR